MEAKLAGLTKELDDIAHKGVCCDVKRIGVAARAGAVGACRGGCSWNRWCGVVLVSCGGCLEAGADDGLRAGADANTGARGGGGVGASPGVCAGGGARADGGV